MDVKQHKFEAFFNHKTVLEEAVPLTHGTCVFSLLFLPMCSLCTLSCFHTLATHKCFTNERAW